MIYKLLLLIIIIFGIYYLNTRYNQLLDKRKIDIIKTNKINRISSDKRIGEIYYLVYNHIIDITKKHLKN